MNPIVEQLKEKIFSKYKKENWEIKTLGEISREIISGNEITKDQLGTGDYPAIRFKEIHDSQIEIKECSSFVNPDLIKNKKYTTYGDILIATTSNIQENSGKACVYLGKEKCLVGNDVKIIKHNQNPKYLSYCLSSDFSKNQFLKLSQESTVFHLYTKDIKQIKIPLPPLEIQNEMVEFLDKFTELENELERELENRRRQYEYYSNRIFDRGINELNWEMKTLEEVSEEMNKGNEVTKAQLNTGEFPAIRFKEIHDSEIKIERCINRVNPDLIKKKKYCVTNDILMADISENLRDLGKSCIYLGREKCLVGNHVIIIRSAQNPKFITYFLSSRFSKSQMEKLGQKSTVYDLYLSKIKQIKIPVPPLEEQERVVEILDKLHKIVGDIKEGIPALIEKNREQYNFYKELLLGR